MKVIEEEGYLSYEFTDEENAFWEQCELQRKYDNIDDYINDIRKWLYLSPWHYKEETANIMINMNMHFIKESFENGDSISAIGVEVGFGCG